MEPMFLYQKWLSKTLSDYMASAKPPKLKGRPITVRPFQYGAALMQAYLGKAPLRWVAEVSGIPLDRLQVWRKQLEFLLLMDWSKSIFSESFRETLLLNEYSVAQYYEIAGEFSLLEDSVQVSVRTQLYRLFDNVGQKIKSNERHGIPTDKYDLNVFSRLFVFSRAFEHHLPNALGNRINEKYYHLAKEVVWPLLGREYTVDSELKSALENCPPAQIRPLLGDRLKETFCRLH